jgi:hypothetical protein
VSVDVDVDGGLDVKAARRLAKERALIEGSIGAIKNSRYNFNRPRARSVDMMGTCGQLAVLGFNLNKGAARTGREAAAGLGRLMRGGVNGGDPSSGRGSRQSRRQRLRPRGRLRRQRAELPDTL